MHADAELGRISHFFVGCGLHLPHRVKLGIFFFLQHMSQEKGHVSLVTEVTGPGHHYQELKVCLSTFGIDHFDQQIPVSADQANRVLSRPHREKPTGPVGVSPGCSGPAPPSSVSISCTTLTSLYVWRKTLCSGTHSAWFLY